MELTVNYTKSEGQYVGQCTDNPQIITVAKTELAIQIQKAVSGYIKTFPKEHKNIIPDGSTTFTVKLIDTT